MRRWLGLSYQLRTRYAYRPILELSPIEMTFTQVLVDQKARDDRIVRLAGMMTDVFAFVEDADPLKKIKTHIKTITLLMQQVTECGYFITDYTKRKNFCQSLLFSDQPTLISL